MPELLPLWERWVSESGADDEAARFLTFWNPPRYLAHCSQAVLVDRDGPLLLRNYDLDPALSEATFDDWVAAQIAAWGAPPQAEDFLKAGREKTLAQDPARDRQFVAYLEGHAAGVCGVQLHRDFAHLTGGAVVPDLRGRGVYRAMVARRLQDLRAEGVETVTAHCLEHTSAPICARLGFEALNRFDYYFWKA